MAVETYSLEPSFVSLLFAVLAHGSIPGKTRKKTTRRVEMAGFESLPPLFAQRRGLSEKKKRRRARWVLGCASLVQGLQDFLVDHGPAGIGEPLGEASRNRCHPGR